MRQGFRSTHGVKGGQRQQDTGVCAVVVKPLRIASPVLGLPHLQRRPRVLGRLQPRPHPHAAARVQHELARGVQQRLLDELPLTGQGRKGGAAARGLWGGGVREDGGVRSCPSVAATEVLCGMGSASGPPPRRPPHLRGPVEPRRNETNLASRNAHTPFSNPQNACPRVNQYLLCQSPPPRCSPPEARLPRRLPRRSPAPRTLPHARTLYSIGGAMTAGGGRSVSASLMSSCAGGCAQPRQEKKASASLLTVSPSSMTHIWAAKRDARQEEG